MKTSSKQIKKPLSKQRKTDSKIDIYGYSVRIEQLYDLIDRDLSSDTAALIKKYDRHLAQHSQSLADRTKNLSAVLTLSRFLNKDWTKLKKDDIDELVFQERFSKYSDNVDVKVL